MSRTAARVSLFGLFLVVFGALLLLRRTGVIDLQMREILWPMLALFGLFIAGRGLADGRRKKIVLGTVLFLYGIFFLVHNLGGFSLPFDSIVPATFIVFGVVFVMLFVNRPAEWYFLAPGILLLLVGAAFLMTEYGWWYGWEVRDALSTWWPLALVLMGAGMLLRRRPSTGSDGPAAHPADTGAGPTGFVSGPSGSPPPTGEGSV